MNHNHEQWLEQAGEGRAGADDALTFYLKEMGSIPLLRPAEEQRLVRRLDCARRRYRRAVLASWFVLGRLLDAFEELGDKSVDRHIDVVPGLGLTGEIVQARLPGHLPRLRRLVRQSARTFADRLRADGAEQDRLRRQLVRRLRQAIRLAEELSPRTELVGHWAAELEEQHQAVTRLSQPVSRSAADRALRSRRVKELRQRLLALAATPEELAHQLEVVRRRQAAYQQLRRRLAEANLRLVISVAKRYRGMGLAFADLIQEGNGGLLRAVDKFDHRLGFKFGTYATWWIRQGVTRALSDQSRTVRVPCHLIRLLRDIESAQQQLALDLGRDPSIEEVAACTGIPADEVRSLRQSGHAPASLQESVGADEDQSLADFLTDKGADPAEAVNSLMLRERLEEALRTLPARDREVIELRFGLKDGRARSLEEVSRRYGITRERIRQIECRGLDRLREANRRRDLAEFVNG